MVVKKKKSTEDLSNRQLLNILMQEIADVRHELKGEISGLRVELKGDISGLRMELKGEISGLRGDLQDFRDESHQNQVAFITNQQDHENRIMVLERR